MDTQQGQRNRQWKMLCWNGRGMNAQSKLTTIKSKIKEANCDIIYFHETKKEVFDVNFIKTFAHRVLTALNLSHLLGSQEA
jgi:hypothetical protein